jgi:hypothetical protein
MKKMKKLDPRLTETRETSRKVTRIFKKQLIQGKWLMISGVILFALGFLISLSWLIALGFLIAVAGVVWMAPAVCWFFLKWWFKKTHIEE